MGQTRRVTTRVCRRKRPEPPGAGTNTVPIPDEISDDQAILMSDILPTSWFGVDLAEVADGETLAVFGCGPVGLMAIASAFVMGAGRVIAVDRLPDRLVMAEKLGAEGVNLDEVEVAKTIAEMTNGDGADKVIDAVGIEEAVVQRLTEPMAHAHGSHFVAGDKPAQAFDWLILLHGSRSSGGRGASRSRRSRRRDFTSSL